MKLRLGAEFSPELVTDGQQGHRRVWKAQNSKLLIHSPCTQLWVELDLVFRAIERSNRSVSDLDLKLWGSWSLLQLLSLSFSNDFESILEFLRYLLLWCNLGWSHPLRSLDLVETGSKFWLGLKHTPDQSFCRRWNCIYTRTRLLVHLPEPFWLVVDYGLKEVVIFDCTAEWHALEEHSKQ